MKLLIANRAEVAVRVIRAARELGVATVAVVSEDDRDSPHPSLADETHALPGMGPPAYLDIESILKAARERGCSAIHPGYGFLSESAEFARRCEAAGLTFVGPSPETLEQLGDKASARGLAREQGIRVLAGADSLAEAKSLLESLGPDDSIFVKAVAGGGGRGLRRVTNVDELADAWDRCASEARAAFGSEGVYAERCLTGARHIEVQVIGDGTGAVVHLGERECSLQRSHQKIVELAPSPWISPEVRGDLFAASLRLARALDYRGLGTFEFLVRGGPDRRGGGGGRGRDGDRDREADPEWAFLEANPRLQVEHTVTEEVTGFDLVEAQLRIAQGETLADLGLGDGEESATRGHAIQVRINMERLEPDGSVRPTGGTLSCYETPSGPGVRIDGFARSGYATNPRFDSLLLKLVVHSSAPDFGALLRRARRALEELRIEGVETNRNFQRALLAHPDIETGAFTTTFVEDHLSQLLSESSRLSSEEQHAANGTGNANDTADASPSPRSHAGARLEGNDPLALFDHARSPGAGPSGPSPNPLAPSSAQAPPGTAALFAPIQGTIVSVEVVPGALVHAGQPLLVMEAMKMEHVIAAPQSGRVRSIAVAAHDTVYEGHALLFIEPGEVEGDLGVSDEEIDLDHIRPDLAEVIERHAFGHDAARPEAVARRRKTGQRTCRENVEDLCDPDTFIEYGPLTIAAQRRRRGVEDLIRATPADGMIAGIGSVNGETFGDEKSRCAILSYDYTVLAGTQGAQNHRKKDRLFELAEQWRLPLVFFTEGGGGRPGDTDGLGVAGLDCRAFQFFGRLSGLVPLVGINSGRCFAGNAALLGCCDVVIATQNSNIGMGGPAMIEGGGLGVFRPEEVGPMHVQVPNGVVDIAVEDEAEAVEVARRYLSYFQGAVSQHSCEDQRRLRAAIPENRLRIYEVRDVIELLADTGSVLELRRAFGPGMVTALARIEGRPIGILANNPTHLAGAIDSNGADKAARFLQLCDAFDLPVLSLCDTPGIMVGPEAEQTALVRHAARLFVTGASLSVPFFTVVLRKGYGLGAQAMAAGSFKAPFFTVAWPTGEFGGMGLEGAVKLGFRKELAAEEDPERRRALFDEMVARMYRHGKAINMASHFEIDGVIDPADTRHWISRGLRSIPPPPRREGKKRPCIDTW